MWLHVLVILHLKWLALSRSKFKCGLAIMRILWIRILRKCCELHILDPWWCQCGSWSLNNSFIFCWVVQPWTASPISPRRGWRHMVLPAGCRVGVGGWGGLWNSCTWQDRSAQSTDWCTTLAEGKQGITFNLPTEYGKTIKITAGSHLWRIKMINWFWETKLFFCPVWPQWQIDSHR